MAIEITAVKCACTDCVCIVPVAQAIKRESRMFCSDLCADHHRDGAGCHHAGCECRG